MNLPPAATAGDADRILLVDDDPTNISILRNTLDGHGYKLMAATSGEDALRVALRARPSLVLLDVLMPGIDGYETCRRLKGDPATADAAVIFLSALEDAREKVRGLEAGAVDFVTKPFEPEEVLARVHTHLTVQRLQRQLAGRNAELQRELAVAQELLTEARRRVDGPLLGDSPAARALRESIASHAATLDPLVLTGPHGVGQEAVARAIHHASARSRQPFIHVNCALLAAGQSSGSIVTAAGALDPAGPQLSQLDLAERGTLFLEEIHRMPAALQQSLGVVLEAATRQRERGEPASPDVRVLASTSGPLSSEGGFHAALLARLEPRQLRVPALAERTEDIPDLARFFVSQHARRLGAVVERISDDSLKRMQAYRWPGNVRELESVLERAVVSAREPVLEIDKALLDEGLPLGHYRLIEKLGEGGMGEVWRARHQLLARPCAVKLIRPDRLGGNRDAAVGRFRLEARAISRLTSPNTVRLYDFGVSETGSLYFVMELLDGLDLFNLIQRFGPMPAARAVPILRQACRSLAEAHAAGLLHRDIKPHNLFLCRLGVDFDVVKVLDFGLVKSVGEDDANLTADGVLTGTPAYMPPERVTGSPGGETSDLYSLGCVAFWMLTGKTVFSGDQMAMLIHHVRTPAPRPSDVLGALVSAPLEQLVLDCLAKEPTQRPASALALDRRLAELERADPWGQEQAERWWHEHVPQLPASAAGGDQSEGFVSLG